MAKYKYVDPFPLQTAIIKAWRAHCLKRFPELGGQQWQEILDTGHTRNLETFEWLVDKVFDDGACNGPVFQLSRIGHPKFKVGTWRIDAVGNIDAPCFLKNVKFKVPR